MRIVKLLRALPGVQAQVKVLGDTAGAVGWLLVLIALFLFIFLVLGMNLFGGALMAEWDPESVVLGAAVFIEFPNSEKARFGRVVGMDFYNRSTTPWFVGIQYTDGDAAAVEALRTELHLQPQNNTGDWATWCSTVDDNSVGVPKIIGFPPRYSAALFPTVFFPILLHLLPYRYTKRHRIHLTDALDVCVQQVTDTLDVCVMSLNLLHQVHIHT